MGFSKEGESCFGEVATNVFGGILFVETTPICKYFFRQEMIRVTIFAI